MSNCKTSNSLRETLNDPLIRLVMDADGVDPRALEAELCEMAWTLDEREEAVEV